MVLQLVSNENNNPILKGTSRFGEEVTVTLVDRGGYSEHKSNEQYEPIPKIWKVSNVTIESDKETIRIENIYFEPDSDSAELATEVEAPDGEEYTIGNISFENERSSRYLIERTIVNRQSDGARRIRVNHYGDSINNSKEIEVDRLYRGSYVLQHNGIWMNDDITINKRAYIYNDETHCFEGLPNNSISEFNFMDRVECFCSDISVKYRQGQEIIECGDLVILPPRKNAFTIESDNSVVPGVIFRDFPEYKTETKRRAQILPPGAEVKKHSHALGVNPDGEALIPLGVSVLEGKTNIKEDLQIKVAAADSPSSITEHSIEATSRGYQYWAAIKKPNKPMPENGISNNWSGLDTPEGREEYWSKNGMIMNTEEDGTVVVTDIPSGEKTTMKFEGNIVIMTAYDAYGQQLDTVTYDQEQQRAIHTTIEGNTENWNIGELIKKSQKQKHQTNPAGGPEDFDMV